MANVSDQREKVLNGLMKLLSNSSFTYELVVKKRPKGIRIIHEVTEEEMNAMVENSRKKEGV